MVTTTLDPANFFQDVMSNLRRNEKSVLGIAGKLKA